MLNAVYFVTFCLGAYGCVLAGTAAAETMVKDLSFIEFGTWFALTGLCFFGFAVMIMAAATTGSILIGQIFG